MAGVLLRRSVWLVALASSIAVEIPTAEAVPLFARRYGVSCSQCHVTPPKLNEFGEAFVAGGYEMPGMPRRATWPFALWITGRSESLQGVPTTTEDRLRAYMNRIELIAGGRLGANASYFMEWRALSREARGNGTLRDRSGRFEDLFVTISPGSAEFTIGQYRLLQQVDVSRRVGIAEPLVFSASLPGGGDGSARDISLRGFSPAGRSPALRVAWNENVARGWRWTTSAAVALPGEFSIPLTDSAKVEASNEIEWRRKGVMLESYVRRGLSTFGGHVFYDDSERYLAQLVTTGRRGAVHWAAVTGAAKTGELLAGRWSLEGEYFPNYYLGFGTRVEDRAADGLETAVLPYVNFHFPGTRYTFRLTLERRIQRDRNATVLEVGTVF
jgi:hypothetical protein